MYDIKHKSIHVRMNYDTQYECRYHKTDLFLEEEERLLSNEEKEAIRHFFYQEDLQHIFGQDDIDFSELHANLQKCKEWMEIARQLSLVHLYTENEELGTCILLSYDYLYLSHVCISNYLEHGTIPDKVFEALLSKIKSETNI